VVALKYVIYLGRGICILHFCDGFGRCVAIQEFMRLLIFRGVHSLDVQGSLYIPLRKAFLQGTFSLSQMFLSPPTDLVSCFLALIK